jgi:hypothetical protein
MNYSFLVSSLPQLEFNMPAPLTREKFIEMCEGEWPVKGALLSKWRDLDCQMRNAIAEARGGLKYVRETHGCSLFWRGRITQAFQEKDILKREELIDKVRWDAAGELTPLSSPLSYGALETYAIRLKIVLKRNGVSKKEGDAIFDRLTSAAEQ